jgi:hypothetical protein
LRAIHRWSMLGHWNLQIVGYPRRRRIRMLRASLGLRFPFPPVAILRCRSRRDDSGHLHFRNQRPIERAIEVQRPRSWFFHPVAPAEGVPRQSTFCPYGHTVGQHHRCGRPRRECVWRRAWGHVGAPAFSYSIEQPRHVRPPCGVALNDVDRQNDAAYDNPLHVLPRSWV